MANQLFAAGREGFLDGSIDWDTGTIKAQLLRAYTLNAAHRFLSDITGAGGVLVGSAVTLGVGTGAFKTVTGGTADANDVTFTAVPTQAGNAASNMILIWQASAPAGGVDLATTAQRLIGIIDTATNLPIVTNGGDVNVAWDPAGIFRL